MKKILIVDDEEDLVKVLAKLLIDQGFEIEIARDAYQGIETAQREKPDLIILDLNMPAGGGLGTLESIRTSSKTMSIPVIVLTGADDPELKEKVLEKGVEAYMQKPYEPEDLITKINSCLPAKE
jgi:DNA-binding response OmpR family regulator